MTRLNGLFSGFSSNRRTAVVPLLVFTLLLNAPAVHAAEDEREELRSEPAQAVEDDDRVADESPEPTQQASEPTAQPADPEPAASTEDADAVTTASAEEPIAGDSPDAATNASSDVADDYASEPPAPRSSFNKILPGESTKAELIDLWGEPEATRAAGAGEVLLYEIKPFERVDVLVENDLVEIIRIELARQQQPARLAQRLRADEVESVELVDPDNGELLGMSYPEKGLTFLLSETPAAPSTPQFVTHLVISQLDAEAFALRAENRPASSYKQRLADLSRAIEVDERCALAHYLAAELYLSTGQVDVALESANAALDVAPENSAYRLRLAQALIGVGEYDKAVLETRRVLDAEPDESVVKAAALHTMGRLASLGDAIVSDKAIAFHTQAIAIADKLAALPDTKDRRAAKRLLIESHLAIAIEISRRSYDRKTEVVAQWIGRASGLAEEMIANDSGGLELRLLVARDSLAALASLKPAKDPQPWIDEAVETASAVRESADDDLLAAHVDWMLGEAHYHALRIEHTRGNSDEAIATGEEAIDRLIAGAATGDVRPSAEQLVGNLYFHLGAVHAVHKQDHEAAVEWYNRAYPLLTGEAPDSKLYVPRRAGEAFVSMAVSYWNADQKERAIELTVAGSELMEKVVQSGVLDEKALAVPYGNLATMHRKLGDDSAATEFAQLARNVRGTVATASRETSPSTDSTDNSSRQRRSARR